MTTPRYFAHANVNAVDLARSERFYQRLGLDPRWRTSPAEPQDGTCFGLPDTPVQWTGVLLADHRGVRGPVVDLLQWTQPATTGRAYAERHHLGLSALCFGLPDPDPETDGRARRERHGEDEVLVMHDPDGTRVEISGGASAPTYRGLRINCSDLSRSTDFYQAALGLDTDPLRELEITGAEPGRALVRRMYLPGQREKFSVELTQWIDPAPVGTPQADGSRAGIFRTALIVDDIDAGYDAVVQVAPHAVRPPAIDLGPSLKPVRTVFFTDPDGSTIEFVERGLA